MKLYLANFFTMYTSKKEINEINEHIGEKCNILYSYFYDNEKKVFSKVVGDKSGKKRVIKRIRKRKSWIGK